MPRIDPLQLLKCLSVLLTPEGGILSRDVVPRLVNLMTKFSKKLVSKCVYVLVLKSTETELVDLFMAEGGWCLILTWLQDAVQTSNWDLVREILGLLLVTPVDVERLKLNILPKLIKSLSRREDLEGVAQLSSQLVQQWLMIVKGHAGQIQQQVNVQNQAQTQNLINSQAEEKIEQTNSVKTEDVQKIVESPHAVLDNEDELETKSHILNEEGLSSAAFYKTSGKDGKIVLRKLSQDSVKDEGKEQSTDDKNKEDKKERDRSKSSKSTSSKSKNLERDGKKSDKDRSRDKDKDRHRKSSGSSSKSSSRHSSSSSRSKDEKDKHREREKAKDRDRGHDKSKNSEKEKHRNNGASKNTTSNSSDKTDKDKKGHKEKDKEKTKEKGKYDEKEKQLEKEKQIEKDNNTLEKIKPPTIDKLGRIPKKNPVEDKPKENTFEVKKKSFSIGVRKDKENEERPKTVKVFNSKMRSTGLEEEVKPAPPRSVSAKKPTPSVQLPTIPQKRPSPPKDIRAEPLIPEKKLKLDKIDVPDRPGAIKLIPPKPKPVMLLESDLFNDALTAASTKKEPKKRKRRPSVSKDGKEVPSSPTTSVNQTQDQAPSASSPHRTTSSPPLVLKNIAPTNFYQDTLTEEVDENNKSTEVDKETVTEISDDLNESVSEEVKEIPLSPPKTPTDEQDDEPLVPKKQKLEGGLKGVLLYTKKKGPKKSISWKSEADLVETRYFELDETERVNVSRNFGDMAKMELSSEREALQLRKTIGEDVMEPIIQWKVPFPIDLDEPLVAPGSKSKEKEIQFAREKSVLPALYFDRNRIPDSPEEPIPENHQIVDPTIIPLDDPESQEIDLRSTPWPEPKGTAPYQEPPPINQPFVNMPNQFDAQFGNGGPPPFNFVPQRFPGPGNPIHPMGPMAPGNFGPGKMNMIPNNMLAPPNMAPAPHEMMNMNHNLNINPNMNINPIINPNLNPAMNPNMNHNMNPNIFQGAPGPEKFRQGQDFPMYGNQNPNNMNNMPMNMYQHQPPQQQNNFPNHRSNNSRGFRRGGGGQGGRSNWSRGHSDNNWKRGGGRGGRICKNIQNHGYCRNIENCTFVHP